MTTSEAQRIVDGLLRRAHQVHWSPRFGTIAPPLVPAVTSVSLQGPVLRLLGAELRAAVRMLWRNGWQPADLHRLARRALDADASAVLGDAVTEALGSHARATVDPQWWEQLEDAGWTRWWPAEETALTARLTRTAPPGQPNEQDGQPVVTGGRDEFVALSQTVAAVVGLAQRLPGIALLGPLPGEYAAQGRPTDGRGRPGVQVEAKMLQRVRQMLAKAESTPYEAEAETFTSAAQKLMARHSIDLAMLENRPGELRSGPRTIRVGIDRPYEAPKAVLLSAIATANRCHAVWNRNFGTCTVVGFPADVHTVEVLFTSLLVQAVSAMTSPAVATDGGSRTRGFRSSFLTAYAGRIGSRLQEVMAAETQEAAAHARPGELVRVLDNRSAEVRDVVNQLFPETTSMRRSRVSDPRGWAHGTAAADRAQFDQRRAVN